MIQISENTTILHYQIKHLLARGGMSAIYLAHDTITNRDVAIKLVHADEFDYYERFRREARAVTRLQHDHILPAFDYGEYSSWFYMVMPYIEYGTLRNRLINGPLALREAGRILTQLADAVQHAHEQGIVHRDIKPSNILLRDGEHVYLADFGLVRRMEERTGLTQTGFIIGTPEYMAPEMTEQPATPSSDIYALGIVLYQMLTGRAPFNGSTPVAICLKHVNEQPLPPSVHNPALSTAIDSVVLRALAKDPVQRFQHANDLANAFQAALRNMTLVHNPPTSTAKIQATNKKKRVGLLAVAAILLFLLPGLLGFVSFFGHIPAAAILGANLLNRGQTLTKPPIAHPTATKTSSPTLHTTGTAVNTYRNRHINVDIANHDGGANSHKGNSNGGGDGSSKGRGNGGGDNGKHGNGKGKGNEKGNGGDGGHGNGKGHGHGGGGGDD
jgi:serine/threonine protein kinase